MHRVTLSVGLGLLLVSSACGRSRPASPSAGGASPSAATPPRTTISAPFEIRTVMQRVQSTFRDEGAGFAVSRSSYAAQVSPAGEAAFTPRVVEAGADADEAQVVQAIASARTVREGPPARFSTVEIRRGDAAAAAGEPPLRAADGSILVAHGDVLERIASTERGLEQSWTFPARPRGRGDLTIRVAVAGVSPVGATAGGLHFQDAASDVGVRYGTATWIDGVGRATDVPARLDGGDVVLTVPEALVERSAYPAVLDPLISAELALDDDVTVYASYNAVVASNGTDFLLAWSDVPSGSAGAHVVAARVSAQGAVLDPTGIVVTPGGVRYWGSLGAAGNPVTGSYLVTWTELRDGAPILSNGDVYASDLYTHGAFVAASGQTTTALVGASPRLFGPGRPASRGPGFAVAGTGFDANGSGVYAVYQVDDVGGALGWLQQASFPWMLGTSNYAPGIGCKSTGDCVVAWVVLQNGVYTPAVGWSGGTMHVLGAAWPAGGGVGPLTELAISGAMEPALIPRTSVIPGRDGDPYLLMWTSLDAASIPRVWGLLADADPVNPYVVAPRLAGPTVLTGDAARPRVASGTWDGQNFVVVEGDRRWGTRTTAYGFRVDPATATVLPPGELMLSNPMEGSFASAAWASASGVGLVQWTPLTSSMLTTRFRDDPSAGLLIDWPGGRPINVVVGHSETSPKADFDGSSYLVTWIDDRAGSQVLGARVSQAGAVIDAAPVLLVPLATVQSHALTWNGENHVLAWVDSTDHTVKMSRVTPALGILDLGVAVGALDPGMVEAGNVRVVASGRDLLVLWPVYDSTTGTRALYARRMSGDAVPLDPAPVVVAQNVTAFSVASSGSGWLVSYFGPTSTVRGFVVGVDGTRGAEFAVADTLSYQLYPTVVFDGARYRVVWRDARSDPAGQLYTARFEVDGTRTPGADVQVTATATPHNQASAVFDGQNTLVLWHDSTSRGVGSLHGTWVTADGALVDADTILAPGILGLPRAHVSNGAGTALVAYAVTDPATRLSRVMARLVTEGASLVISRSGSGAGRVTSQPAGIDCGAACAAAFEAGASVTLTATADAGSVFAGWSGACTGTAPCTVAAGAVAQVSAKFDLRAATGSFPLTISYAGTGTGIATPDVAAGTYPVGTVLHVTAIADPDSRFTSWSGACRGTAPVCTLVVGGPVELTALFDRGAAQPWTYPQLQLLPGAGPIAGGTSVTLTGYGFFPTPSVTFGGNAAASVTPSLDGTSAVAIAPPGLAAGPVDVIVGLATGQVTTLPAAFTYFDASGNTPAGQDVTVVPTGTADVPLVQMHFDEIQSAGETTVTPLASAPPVPTEFFVVAAPTQPRFLEVQTAASYRGKIELAITYDPAAMGLTGEQERALRLIHFDGTRWEDATEVANPHTPPYGDADPHFFGRNSPPFVNPDTRTRTLYGVVTSFSPIALAVGGASAGSGVGLGVAVYGPGTGRVQGSGIDCGQGGDGTCATSFSLDGGPQVVDLVAVPDAGSTLWAWSGPCAGTGTCRVTMNASQWVVAAFKPDSNVLTARVIGGGTVTSAGPGISCRPDATSGCALRVTDTPGASITLTATPDPGSVFKGWSAPCLGSTAAQCTVDVHAGVVVIATFAPATLPVTLRPFGDGGGTISGGGVTCAVPDGQCRLDVPNTTPPTSVTFQAQPATDSLFLGWGGMCSGTAPTCTLSMTGWGEVQAYFTPRTYPLAVTFQGTGTGRVDGGGLACATGATGATGTCLVDVANGSSPPTVTLAPTADAGSRFAGWAGACDGAGPGPCTVTMRGARTAIAQFDRVAP